MRGNGWGSLWIAQETRGAMGETGWHRLALEDSGRLSIRPQPRHRILSPYDHTKVSALDYESSGWAISLGHRRQPSFSGRSAGAPGGLLKAIANQYIEHTESHVIDPLGRIYRRQNFQPLDTVHALKAQKTA